MPEAVVAWACMDYYEVAKDYDVMNKKFERWTLKHSYFARMGGFVISAESTDDKKKENEPMRSGRQLLEQGAKLSEDICERLELEIIDKSKADFLTKALAITQITRFLFETIARGVGSLAVSPLEYFTSAHVLSALLMYIFWFHKPHGVMEKITLQREAYAFWRYKTETKLGSKGEGLAKRIKILSCNMRLTYAFRVDSNIGCIWIYGGFDRCEYIGFLERGVSDRQDTFNLENLQHCLGSDSLNIAAGCTGL